MHTHTHDVTLPDLHKVLSTVETKRAHETQTTTEEACKKVFLHFHVGLRA